MKPLVTEWVEMGLLEQKNTRKNEMIRNEMN